MTLYRKYRPQTLDELDLKAVRQTLKQIITSKKSDLPHAFLFAGPKGTGKTSAARILAKVVNCQNPTKDGEPCNACEQCQTISKGVNIDVIEIDAASNRGIDDIRALRENIALAPVSAKKKIYIIDEVHMLTNEASNAFLKTLEEPPSHVVFILATTNPEKLPETVLSRLTQITFQKASLEEVTRQLARVSEGEGLEIEEKALKLISQAGGGSFRDAVKIVEELMFAGNKKITEAVVAEFLFKSSQFDPKAILANILQGKNVILTVEDLYQKGVDIKLFTDFLLLELQTKMVASAKEGKDFSQLASLIDDLLASREKIAKSPLPQLPLQILLAKWTKERVPQPDQKPVEVKSEVKEEKNSGKKNDLDISSWSKVLENIKGKSTSLEALLKAATPRGFDGKTLELAVCYQFHKEKLETAQTRKVLEDVVAGVFGRNIKISYILEQKEKRVVVPDILTDSQDNDIIQAAKEIFS